MAQTDTTDTKSQSDAPAGGSARDAASSHHDATTPRTLVPQFALDAADARIATWSGAIVDAADTIERLVASESLPVPDTVRELATATTQKLRSLGAQSGEIDAAELVSGLQRRAAAHPAASIGIGAAIGATLATLLVRLGTAAPAGSGASGKTGTATSSGRRNQGSGAGGRRESDEETGNGTAAGATKPKSSGNR